MRKSDRALLGRDDGGSELLSFLTLSEKRKNLLLLHLEGPRSLQEIKKSLDVTSSGIIPQIRKMESRNLILQEGRNYLLTEVGMVLAKSIERLCQTAEMFSRNEKFWMDHNISVIPEELLMRLHEIGKVNIFESTPVDIFKAHEEYMKNLLKSNYVQGVSPVLHPEYPKSLLILAEKGVKTSIVVTDEVFQELKKKYKDELRDYLGHSNAEMLVSSEDIWIAFTVTDIFLSMRLFFKDGSYDFYKNIIGHDRSALGWGEDLFKYYRSRSSTIEIEDLAK